MAAATYSFNTKSSGASWNTGGDWTNLSGQTTGVAPTSTNGDLAEITQATTVTVTDTTSGAGGLIINGTASALLSMTAANSLLTINNTTTLTAGKITINNASAEFSTGGLNDGSGSAGGGVISLSAGTLAVGSSGVALSAATAKNFNLTGGVFTDAGGLTVGGLGQFTDDVASTVTGLVNITANSSNNIGGANAPSIQYGTLTVGGNTTLGNAVVTINKGAATVNAGTTFTMSGGTLVATTGGIVNNGVMTGTGDLTGGISGTGTITASGGLLEIGNTSTDPTLNIANTTTSILKLDALQNNDIVTFAGGTGGILELNSSSNIFTGGTIAGMQAWGGTAKTDVINVQGVVTSASETGGTLTINETGGVTTTITLKTPGSSTSVASWRSDSALGGSLGGYDVYLVCYAAGTRIQTPDGDAAVEDLAPGDSVITLDGDRQVAASVKWVGHRRLDIAAHPRPEMVAPVRIRRGAFGENLPRRDLVLSPDHCMFVDGKLIPVKLLINDMTVVQERETRAVTYYHVELDRHAVLLAEGLPAESYLDTGNRAFFSNAGIALMLHPEFQVNAGLRCWETDACAPLAVSEPAVEPVWRRLAERAESLGYVRTEIATTDDADLHLLADGRSIRPVSVDGARHVFVLPRGASAVRLSSRAGAPSDLVPYLEDWRRLGVAVSRIVVRSAQEQADIPADHPALTQGWHAVEREGAAVWRWTDGNARLPIAGGDMPLTVEVHVRQSTTYRLPETAAADRLVA